MPKRYPENLEGKSVQVGENEYFAYPGEGNELFDLFNRAVRELYLINNTPLLSKTTTDNFEKLLDYCAEKLGV